VRVEKAALERFRKTPDGALLGVDFVERFKDEYPWEVGETYKLTQLRGVSITFVGTFESDNEVYNSIILSDRRYLQQIADKLGVAHQVFVRIDDAENADTVVATLDKELPQQFPFQTITRDQRSFMSHAVEDLRDVIELSHLIILVTLSVMLLAVANTVSMSTRDRAQEFGILRSLGFGRAHIVTLVVGESFLVTMVGGTLGLGVALALLNLQDLYYGLRGVNMMIHVTPPVALGALTIAALVGLLGGLVPAVTASRLDIVTSLRNTD
jgi:putative ABC transport system permease protein